MSLLTPFFLAGLALLAGPIIAHLIRRATKDRIEFSAIRFLNPSKPRLDRRSRVQHPLLLLLRCLIVVALALAFARPYWTQTTPPTASETQPRIVIALLDRSASMQPPARWADATTRVNAIVEALEPSDIFSLITFDARTEILLTGEQWQSALPSERPGIVSSLLSDQSPSWSATHLDNAIATALESVRELNESIGGSASSELLIVSDLTAGTRVAGLAGLDWPAHTQVKFDSVTAASDPDQIALQWLGWGTDLGAGAPARVRLIGTPGATPRSVSLQLVDASNDAPWAPPIETVMPSSGTQLASVPVSPDSPAALRITLPDTPNSLGQSLNLVRHVDREIQFKIWSDSPSSDLSSPRFYLENAITGWIDPATIADDPSQPDTPTLHVITSPLNPTEISTVKSRLEAGAFVILLANSPELAAQAATLAGETNWRASTTSRSNPLLFGEIDFGHPLFASFADPRFSDFTRIRFTRPTSLTLPADTRTQVIARFDNGEPAVLETAVERGRLIVWATGWGPRETPWVLSTKFVPWLQAVAERAAGGTIPVAVTELGDLSRLNLPAESTITALRDPDTAIDQLTQPGIYQVTVPETRPRLIALNVPASETNPEPLAWDIFEALGVPLSNTLAVSESVDVPTGDLPESALVSESRQRAWRWFVLLAIALLLVEGIVALVINRRASAAVPAPANP